MNGATLFSTPVPERPLTSPVGTKGNPGTYRKTLLKRTYSLSRQRVKGTRQWKKLQRDQRNLPGSGNCIQIPSSCTDHSLLPWAAAFCFTFRYSKPYCFPPQNSLWEAFPEQKVVRVTPLVLVLILWEAVQVSKRWCPCFKTHTNISLYQKPQGQAGDFTWYLVELASRFCSAKQLNTIVTKHKLFIQLEKLGFPLHMQNKVIPRLNVHTAQHFLSVRAFLVTQQPLTPRIEYLSTLILKKSLTLDKVCLLQYKDKWSLPIA